MKYRYLLGDSSQESARLRAQARLWDPVAHALFDRLGVGPGWKVLEVGPGQGSLHLELRRRVGGPIDAVEHSPAFAAGLAKLCARDGLGAGTIWQQDLADAPLPANTYDLVFARWVFLFLPEPAAHVRKLVRALKPGGLLAIEDYYRETFAMVPMPADWSDAVAADVAFFATQGGDANVGTHLPTMYKRAGLEMVEVRPEIKTGHPGSPVWNWLTSYYLGVLDRYGDIAPMTKAKAARLRRHWLAAEKEKTSLIVAPAVFDVVGRKRR
jgi:SAM-dependent methyltransferase